MRTVYHGAIEQVSAPLVHVGRDNLDFGKGFYVTDIRSQAKTWALIKARYMMDGRAFINEYLFDFDNAIIEYNYKKFEHYDSDWLHFIIDSREGLKVWKKYDIIEGGVACSQGVCPPVSISGMLFHIFLYRLISSSFSYPSSSVSIISKTVPLILKVLDLVDGDIVDELDMMRLLP